MAQIKEIKNLKVGARGSELSKIQSELIIETLKFHYPHINFTFVPIKTRGDNPEAKPTFDLGVKGLFVKEIEAALQKKQIDLAVHSAKDLASDVPQGLTVCPALQREEPWDVLVTATRLDVSLLASRSSIGTSSLRRQAFLRTYRKDLIIKPLRGNVGTRLKAVGNLLTGVVLAQAALSRLKLKHEYKVQVLSPEILPPAPGQGQLALEYREADKFMVELLQPLNHFPSSLAFYAERAFIREMGIGCSEPISALCTLESSNRLLVSSAMIYHGQTFKEEKSINLPTMVQQITNGRVSFAKKDFGPQEYALAEKLGRLVASGLKEKQYQGTFSL
ncbi:MAG: hydroxymethylbilane synthase [Deltaproteobacteria bacterium]|nr:hydroxymethylbilane synthase [Deltaproteobacteria bacterium]